MCYLVLTATDFDDIITIKMKSVVSIIPKIIVKGEKKKPSAFT